MPYRSGRGCAYPGCPSIVRDGYYCPVHIREVNKQYDQNRESAAKRGYGKRWQAIRRMVLRRNPLCEDPYGVHKLDGQVVASNEVDHIVPRSAGGTDDYDNLQALCKSCHSRKTMSETKSSRREKNNDMCETIA